MRDIVLRVFRAGIELRNIIAITSFIVVSTLVLWWAFRELSIDKCLDSGRSWNFEMSECAD